NPTTINFNNNGSEAVLEVRKGTIRFGGNTSDVVTINMVDDLLITNGTASSATLLFQSGDGKLAGSSDLTIRAGGTGNLNVSLGGTLHTFTGTINVDGATSILSVGTSAALGNASNAINLLNDGQFVGTNATAFSLQRTITGNGSI